MENEQPRVDVVVCTNRFGPFLERAIESVRLQTYVEWRLIVVDDGSPLPDAIDQLIGDIPGARVIHQQNRGLPAARNAGVAAGSGELVAFLDDDDVWPADRLEAQIRTMRASPGAVAVCGDGIFIDPDEAVLGQWQSVSAPREEYLSGRAPIPGITTLMYRRDLLSRLGGFDESFSIAEDIEFALRMIRRGPVVHCGAVVVRYRRHDSNMTNALWTVHRDAWERAVAVNIATARGEGARGDVRLLRMLAGAVRQRFSRESAGYVVHLMRERQVLSAVREAVRSFAAAPGAFAGGVYAIVAARVRSRGAMGRGD